MARKDPSPHSMARFIGRVIKGSKPGRAPGFVEPALATLRTKPPTGGEYVHEVKFDGYRVQAHLQGGLPVLKSHCLRPSHPFELEERKQAAF
jgi:bifunctional non-homologous end joining protein LigD